MTESEELPEAGAEADPRDLDARKAAILKAVVTDYVETSIPVGSAQVARDPNVEVSPATVRADMAALERDGYLTHPHTSAGRVPTDKGYRFFVDHLAPPLPLGPVQQEQVQNFFSRAHGEIERMLQDTTRLLAQLTDTAAIVVPPSHERLVVRSSLLTRLNAEHALLVLVLSNGTIERRSVVIPETTPDEDLRAAGNFLDQHFSGKSLDQLGGPDSPLPPSGREELDVLAELGRAAIGATPPPQLALDQMFVGGTSRITEHFEAIDKVRAILSILEQSFVVVTLINDVLSKGQAVSIGSEHGVAPLQECSLVVAPFGGNGRDPGGTIGILGPTRMDYPQALAAVAIVGRRLSRELEEG